MLLPAAALSNPYAIFAHARTYWETAVYPGQLSYTVAIHVTRRGVASDAHYHAYYDARHDRVNVNATSDEEIAHPYTPHGINVGINLFGGRIPLSSPQQTFDYLGVPILAPNYSFGIAPYIPHDGLDSAALVAEIRREFHDPMPANRAQSTQTALKTIASIEVVQRTYLITLTGLVPIDGHIDYDLAMRPLRDPGKYRLREAWIDVNTFATDKLVTQGNFTAAATSGVRWTVEFTQINGAPYIASEVAQAGFELDRRAYDTAEVDFTGLMAQQIPAYARWATFAASPSSAPEPLIEP